MLTLWALPSATCANIGKASRAAPLPLAAPSGTGWTKASTNLAKFLMAHIRVACARATTSRARIRAISAATAW